MKFLKGFTLSELMIALAILLVAISALLLVFVNCILMNQSNNNMIVAANDAQYVLEQVKGLAYSNIGSYVAPVFTNLDSETISLTRSIGSEIAEVTVNVSWIERQRQRNLSLSTRVAK